MKCKALRSFFYKDEKTARLMQVQKGEEIMLDHAEYPQLIFELLSSLEIIDKNFVPERAKYLVVSYVNYETKEGFPREGRPGDEIELPQDVACKYLVSGHIKPASEKQWRPRFLLGDSIKDDTVIRMFDDPLPEKESWIKKSGLRSWRD